MPPRKRTRAAATSSSGAEPSGKNTEQEAAVAIEIASSEGEDELRSNLAALWREGSLCDVTIIVGARQYPAHRAVLAAASPYMKSMLAGDFAESRAKEITLQELSESAFDSVLKFVYERKCTLPSADALQEVLLAACRLRVEALQQACCSAIIDRLSPAVCLDAWDLAERLSLERLTAAAKKVALNAFGEVSASPGFAVLPAARLDELLADDELNVVREEQALPPRTAATCSWHCRGFPSPPRPRPRPAPTHAHPPTREHHSSPPRRHSRRWKSGWTRSRRRRRAA